MERYLFALLLMAAFLQACKKDIPETPCVPEFPGEYFPAYPGSYWNFRKANNDPFSYTISAEYEQCEGACRPVFMNLGKCIAGAAIVHRFYAGLGITSTAHSPIYSLTEDSVMNSPVSFATLQHQDYILDNVYCKRVTLSTDTTVTLPDLQVFQHVLVVKEYDENAPGHYYLDYFAKNTGLVRRDSVNDANPSVLNTILWLETYHIGN